MVLHFTKKLDVIESILESGSFKLGYCTEYFGYKNKIISKAAHPMVCFSEYTESELHKQNITYGGYAVGLSKKWASSKGLNPVLYIDKNSQAAIGLASLLKARQKHGKDNIPSNLRLPIMQIKCFTKHETGYNSYLKRDKFCFKCENEWRYVPTKSQIGGEYISLNESTFLRNKAKYNDRLKNFPLKFQDTDIQAIYVKTKKELASLKSLFPNLDSKIKLKIWT